MITIRCSQLEQIRQNPQAYALSLAIGEKNGNAGSYGMFACMKDIVKTVHQGERDLNKAVSDLQLKFMRYAVNPHNIAKQEHLIQEMLVYCALYEEMNFELIDGAHQIRWNINKLGRLSGLTPWVVKNSNGYFSYLIVEKASNWRYELRFPLYQQYIASTTIKCDIHKLHVGIFDISSQRFDFDCFSTSIIKDAINETSTIFQQVNKSYYNIKKI